MGTTASIAQTDRLLTTKRSVRRPLDLARTVAPALLPIVCCTGDGFKPARGRPVEEPTYWDEWKNTLVGKA
jgi:hypothetical protein